MSLTSCARFSSNQSREQILVYATDHEELKNSIAVQELVTEMTQSTVRHQVLVALVLVLISACSTSKLGGELERARETYGYIRLEAPSQSQFGGEFLVALYSKQETGLKLVGMRSPSPGADSIFLVPIADYEVVAFEDISGDFILQNGEPLQYQKEVFIYTAETITEKGQFNEQFPPQSIQLSANASVDFSVDLSTQSVLRQSERAQTNFLAVVDWTDPRFSVDASNQGMWEPISFQEQVGSGLYVLEPLDPTKEQVLFVHGIQGSPAQFKELADSLSNQYQVLLFQYPSGFALQDSAHILQNTIDDLLKRYPIKKLHVIAHSMGGLVARGAIAGWDKKDAHKLHTFITLATPWLGHDAARWGVKWSPAVAPVWRSMVPNSEFQQSIFSQRLPKNINHLLIFTDSHTKNGPSSGNDGVVTVKSQLGLKAQAEASAIYGIDDNHVGVLTNKCVATWVNTFLQSQRPEADEAYILEEQNC
jgi:pimeloyl-ACP methyl ester carboxylesterase